MRHHLGLGWLVGSIALISSLSLAGCTQDAPRADIAGNDKLPSCEFVRDAQGVTRLQCADASVAFPDELNSDAASCHIETADGGSAVLRCPDGTSFALTSNGQAQERDASPANDDDAGQTTSDAGVTCHVVTRDAGASTLVCSDGSSHSLDSQTSLAGCTLAQNSDGSSTLSCPDGSSIVLPAPPPPAATDAGVTCHVVTSDAGASTLVCSDGSSHSLDPQSTVLGCTTSQDSAGVVTLSCPDGSSIVLPAPLPPGPGPQVLVETVSLDNAPGCPEVCDVDFNCSASGVLVRVGSDLDGDGVLQTSEVSSRQLLCGPISALPNAGCPPAGSLNLLPASGAVAVARSTTVGVFPFDPAGQGAITLVDKATNASVAGSTTAGNGGLSFTPAQALTPGATYVATLQIIGDCPVNRSWEFTVSTIGMPVVDEDALVGKTYAFSLPQWFGYIDDETLAVSVLSRTEPGAHFANELSLRFGVEAASLVQDQCMPTLDVAADFSASPVVTTEAIPTLYLPVSGGFLVVHDAVVEFLFSPDGTKIGEGTLSGRFAFGESTPNPDSGCYYAQSIGLPPCDGAYETVGTLSGFYGDTLDDVPFTSVAMFAPHDADGDGEDAMLCGGGDCDDDDASNAPTHAESCNQQDDNCNGVIDDVDADGDGYYAASCGGTDCNDDFATTHPGAVETCNFRDDDCASGIDDNCVPGDGESCDTALDVLTGAGSVHLVDSLASATNDMGDVCGSGYDGRDRVYRFQVLVPSTVAWTESLGEVVTSIRYFQCPESPWATCGLPQVLDPGFYMLVVEEVWGVDFDLTLTVTEYDPGSGGPGGDSDGDGATDDVDCDPYDPSIHPGAQEICDYVDNDCNNRIDELSDADQDGAWLYCSYTGNNYYDFDCDDNDPDVSPHLAEICGDQKNNDCYGSADDIDADSDGFVSVACGGADCDDTHKLVHPYATDYCNGLDDDCSSAIDDNCTPLDADTCWSAQPLLTGPGSADVVDSLYYAHDDLFGNCGNFTRERLYRVDFTTETIVWVSDSSGNTNTWLTTDCGGGNILGFEQGGYVLSPGTHYIEVEECGGGVAYHLEVTAIEYATWDPDGDGVPATSDCDSADPQVYPGATETCDGKDNDCDANVDGESDADADAYYASVCGGPNVDCDDSAVAVHPNARELCADGVDNDCDGTVDVVDADHDGFAAASCGGNDCDDTVAAVHPGVYGCP